MATSQKKTGGSRSASSSSGGRRTASSSSKSKSGSSRSRKQPPAPAHRPFRREVGAGICLLLAIFTIFGCFRIQALFIDALCGLIKGLIGYGFWLMPPALLLASFILAFHRGRPVRLRVFCALMLPLMFSCVVHSVIAESLPWDASLAQTLWQSGEALSSGGVLSGVLGQAFVQVFSRVGAAVVFVLALLMLGLGAFNRTIVDVADWFFSRPRYEYEPQDPPEPPVRTSEWLWTILLTCIPVVNLVMLFVWGFGNTTKRSKRNWARAQLVITAIGIVLSIVLVVALMAVGASMLYSDWGYGMPYHYYY